MKKKYDQYHSRRNTIAVRMRKEFADILKDYAKKRGKTYSKMLDRWFMYGLGWVQKEYEWYEQFGKLATFDEDLVELFTIGKIGKVIKKYELEELMKKSEQRRETSSEGDKK